MTGKITTEPSIHDVKNLVLKKDSKGKVLKGNFAMELYKSKGNRHRLAGWTFMVGTIDTNCPISLFLVHAEGSGYRTQSEASGIAYDMRDKLVDLANSL